MLRLLLHQTLVLLFALGVQGISPLVTRAETSSDETGTSGPFAKENLVAWCIVPFDGKKRGPDARAKMLKDLGIKRVAYDWRKEHVPSFEQEILAYQKNGLEYFAFWGEHDKAFELFQKYDLHPQIWHMFPDPEKSDHATMVQSAVKGLLPLVERTREMGFALGLYNHGGWAGEPENLVAICKYLHEQHDADHVGIVYNQHHAHDQVDQYAESIAMMKPYLLCLNLNGMTRDGEKKGKKILLLGEGELDQSLLQVIADSGYDGPVGIIGHTQDDVEQRLRGNLQGLKKLVQGLAP